MLLKNCSTIQTTSLTQSYTTEDPKRKKENAAQETQESEFIV